MRESTPAEAQYASIAHQLRDRILTLIPDHPEILDMERAGDLFTIPDFKCDDLGPSLAQAGWAFNAAKRQWRETHGG